MSGCWTCVWECLFCSIQILVIWNDVQKGFFPQINTCRSFIVNIIMIVKNSFFYKFKVRLYLSIIFFNKADYVISLPVLYWQSVFHMVKRYHCPFKKLKNHLFEIKKKIMLQTESRTKSILNKENVFCMDRVLFTCITLPLPLSLSLSLCLSFSPQKESSECRIILLE